MSTCCSSSGEFSSTTSFKFSLQKASSLPSLSVCSKRDELLQSGSRRRFPRRGSRSASMLQSASFVRASEAIACNILKKTSTKEGKPSERAATQEDEEEDDISISSHNSGALAVLTEALKLSEFPHHA